MKDKKGPFAECFKFDIFARRANVSYGSCVKDLSAVNNSEAYKCQVLEAFAKSCENHLKGEVALKWRSKSLCRKISTFKVSKE